MSEPAASLPSAQAPAVPPWGAELVEGLAVRLEAAPTPRVVAVDGWSGSGKSALAAWLAPALGAPCVHLDDLVPGWHGLARSVELVVREVLEPLAAGRPARWRRWDWSAASGASAGAGASAGGVSASAAGAKGSPGGWGDEIVLEPAPTVLVEGCGTGATPARPWLAALVWIDVDPAERARRLRSRDDWATYQPWAQVWSDQERALRAGDQPRAHADAVVEDGPLGARIVWRVPDRRVAPLEPGQP